MLFPVWAWNTCSINFPVSPACNFYQLPWPFLEQDGKVPLECRADLVEQVNQGVGQVVLRGRLGVKLIWCGAGNKPDGLTHWGRVTHLCISKLIHWFRWWLGTGQHDKSSDQDFRKDYYGKTCIYHLGLKIQHKNYMSGTAPHGRKFFLFFLNSLMLPLLALFTKN